MLKSREGWLSFSRKTFAVQNSWNSPFVPTNPIDIPKEMVLISPWVIDTQEVPALQLQSQFFGTKSAPWASLNILLDLLATLATLLCVALSKHSSLEPGSVPHCPPQLQRALGWAQGGVAAGAPGDPREAASVEPKNWWKQAGIKAGTAAGIIWDSYCIILDVAMTVTVMLFASSYGRLLVPEANLLRLVKRSAQQLVQESNEF